MMIKPCLNINRNFWCGNYLFILSWESVSSCYDFKEHLKNVTSLKPGPGCLPQFADFMRELLTPAHFDGDDSGRPGHQKLLTFAVFLRAHQGRTCSEWRQAQGKAEEEGETIKPDFKKEVSSFEKSQEIPLALRRERIRKPSDCVFVIRKTVTQVSHPLKHLTAYSPRPVWMGTWGTPGMGWPPCSGQETLLPSRGGQGSPFSLQILYRFKTRLDWRKNLQKDPKIMALLLQVKENLQRASNLETGLDWIYPLCK